MQLDILQKQKEAVQATPQRGKVVVSMRPVRESIRLDIDGNQIDPRTKQIIKLAKDVI